MPTSLSEHDLQNHMSLLSLSRCEWHHSFTTDTPLPHPEAPHTRSGGVLCSLLQALVADRFVLDLAAAPLTGLIGAAISDGADQLDAL